MSGPSETHSTDPALEDAISSIKATHEDETPRGVDAEDAVPGTDSHGATQNEADGVDRG